VWGCGGGGLWVCGVGGGGGGGGGGVEWVECWWGGGGGVCGSLGEEDTSCIVYS
jgi:hypothetical protein